MRTLAVLLSIALVGCVLVVSPDDYGTVCRFQGETSQCGACVAEKCRAAIDACCRDTACDATMDALDRCADKHDASCTALLTANQELGRCAARECGGVCVELRGTSTTTCREPRLGEGSTCTCEVRDGAANDFLCGAKAVPGTICCAPKGWPAAGLSCTCRALSCSPTNDGCFCSLGDFTPKRRECSGVKCCVDKDTCACRARDCYAFEREVESCSVAAVQCGDGQDRVETCSARVNE